MTLSGKTILLTRPETLKCPLKMALEAAGALVISVPLVETRLLSDVKLPPDWQTSDWVLFTSKNAVTAFFNLPSVKHIQSWRMPIAAVGSATAEEIQALGYPVAFIPHTYDGVSAAEELLVQAQLQGGQVFWPCGNLANPAVKAVFVAGKTQLRTCVVYKTQDRGLSPRENQRLGEAIETADMVVFTSPSAVEAYEKLLKRYTPHFIPALACLGETTAAKARQLLEATDRGEVVVVADPQTLQSLGAQIQNTFH